MKNGRRSSLHIRGRRASSIGNGFTAKPHESVDPKDYYRHINVDMPEYNRMRQLLIWCGQRTLERQKSKSRNAIKIAKTVEEIVINGLISGLISPSWYTREDTEDHADKPAMKPHPGNIMNAKRLEEYKAILERLQTEEEQLVSLTTQYHTLHARLLDSCAPLPLDGGPIKMAITDVDLSPLSEEDRAFLTEYCSSDTDGERELDESVRALVERYPFQIDNLRKRLYQASIFDEITHLYCEQLMSNLLATVRKRNEGNMQTKAESGDVLRALTRATLC